MSRKPTPIEIPEMNNQQGPQPREYKYKVEEYDFDKTSIYLLEGNANPEYPSFFMKFV